MSNSRSYLISLLLCSVKGSILLALGLLSVYFTFTLQDNRELIIQVFSGIAITLSVMLFIGNIANYKFKRKRLHYISVPQRIFLAYGKLE